MAASACDRSRRLFAPLGSSVAPVAAFAASPRARPDAINPTLKPMSARRLSVLIFILVISLAPQQACHVLREFAQDQSVRCTRSDPYRIGAVEIRKHLFQVI